MPDAPSNTEPATAQGTHVIGFSAPIVDARAPDLNLHEALVRNKTATFFFTVQGEALTRHSILDGDLLVVDRSLTAGHNAIVVCVIDGDFVVCEMRDTRHAKAEYVLWGVVTGVVRRLKPDSR